MRRRKPVDLSVKRAKVIEVAKVEALNFLRTDRRQISETSDHTSKDDDIFIGRIFYDPGITQRKYFVG